MKYQDRTVGALRVLFLAIGEAFLVIAVANLISDSHVSATPRLAAICTVVGLGSYWVVSTWMPTRRWLDFAIDAAAIFTVNALAAAPSDMVVILYGVVVARAFAGASRVVLARSAYGVAAIAGAVVSVAWSGVIVDWPRLVFEIAIVGFMAVAFALASKIVQAHEAGLEIETLLNRYGVALSGTLGINDQSSLTCTCINSVLHSVGIDDARALVAVPNGTDEIRWIGAEGALAEIDRPAGPAGAVSESDQAEHRFEVECDGKVEGSILVRSEADLPPLARRAISRIANWLGIAFQSRRRLEALERLSIQRRELLSEIVRSREEERAQIAGDLHDGPIQSLTALMFDIDYISGLIADSEYLDAQTEFAEVRGTINCQVADLRTMMAGLLPPVLSEQGLAPAIREHLAGLRRRHEHVVFEFNESGQVSAPADGAVEMTLYRILQESIVNALKHAQPACIDVRLDFSISGTELRVVDDGNGFDVEEMARTKRVGHFGLESMKHRAEMAGGSLEIASSPETGTVVSVLIPFVLDIGGADELSTTAS